MEALPHQQNQRAQNLDLHAVAVVKAGVFSVLKIAIYVFGIDFLARDGLSDLLVAIAAVTILAASIRSPMHVVESMLIGADCCTIPPKVLWQLSQHPLTDKGLDAFLKDWDAAGTNI